MQSFKNYLIENNDHLDVKCIRGPYWLPDEDPEADEHFGYECTVNGKTIIVGEEPEDGFRYIQAWDGDAYKLYNKDRNKILPLLRKAIEKHELKQHMSKDTGESFGGLIDVL
jgi:hypothetical protein